MMTDQTVQQMADDLAQKVADLSGLDEDVEVTVTEFPPGGNVFKKKTTYRAIRTETGLGIGAWQGSVQTGDILSSDTHPQAVLDALLASDVIVENTKEEDAEH